MLDRKQEAVDSVLLEMARYLVVSVLSLIVLVLLLLLLRNLNVKMQRAP